jgi:hypothetical protein
VSSGIDKYPLKNLRIFAESDYDWYDHKFAQVGLGFGVEPTERIVFSSAYRVLTSPVVETSRVLTNELVYRFSPKYQVALLEQDDLTGGFIAQRSITLRRFGHDYVCELSYNVDQGSSERGIAISFTPLVLWRNKTRPTFPAGDRPILTPDLGQ